MPVEEVRTDPPETYPRRQFSLDRMTLGQVADFQSRYDDRDRRYRAAVTEFRYREVRAAERVAEAAEKEADAAERTAAHTAKSAKYIRWSVIAIVIAALVQAGAALWVGFSLSRSSDPPSAASPPVVAPAPEPADATPTP